MTHRVASMVWRSISHQGTYCIMGTVNTRTAAYSILSWIFQGYIACVYCPDLYTLPPVQNVPVCGRQEHMYSITSEQGYCMQGVASVD